MQTGQQHAKLRSISVSLSPYTQSAELAPKGRTPAWTSASARHWKPVKLGGRRQQPMGRGRSCAADGQTRKRPAATREKSAEPSLCSNAFTRKTAWHDECPFRTGRPPRCRCEAFPRFSIFAPASIYHAAVSLQAFPPHLSLS